MIKYTLILSVVILFSCKNKPTNQTNIVSESKNTLKETDQNLEKETITFPSKDRLPITADIYKIKEAPITVLLCHQAGYSRGEYKDTALEFNKLEYTVMAIDQRSGKTVNNINNQTAIAARSKGLGDTYLDAKQDIEAAIDYIYNQNGGKQILLVGSSYSASLALLIGNNNSKIKAVAAFSPGEYFKDIDINKAISTYKKPVFVTSSKSESAGVTTLVNSINPGYVTHFIPEVKGIHGSRALWKTTEGNETYWTAFGGFLSSLKVL
ncbi:alpha/beta hydrolase [Polaribacter sp. MSW13]|uniref:Alpha/beta hydrolase n=1 Tax=Polaribacter marinus TaxID=2916838 RepID=A0A9X1VTX4_9FLAO|nr:alpha/beta hydrolase [Polaribacter marinus]MCI2229456.1 alpha/beta hydrolase [Polaribacter marinus]